MKQGCRVEMRKTTIHKKGSPNNKNESVQNKYLDKKSTDGRERY